MHAAILPASLAFAASLTLAVCVAVRRDRSDLHWSILATCVALMFWTSGVVLRFSVVTEEGLRSAITLVCIGVFVTPPLWLVLATRYVRLRIPSAKPIYFHGRMGGMLASPEEVMEKVREIRSGEAQEQCRSNCGDDSAHDNYPPQFA